MDSSSNSLQGTHSKKNGILHLFKSSSNKKTSYSEKNHLSLHHSNPEESGISKQNIHGGTEQKLELVSASNVDFTDRRLSEPVAVRPSWSLSSGSESCLGYSVDQQFASRGAVLVKPCNHNVSSPPCRACMKLPPLPPGADAMLLEKSRQEKDRIRSAKKSKNNANRENNLTQGDKIGINAFSKKFENRLWNEPKWHNENIYEEIPCVVTNSQQLPNKVTSLIATTTKSGDGENSFAQNSCRIEITNSHSQSQEPTVSSTSMLSVNNANQKQLPYRFPTEVHPTQGYLSQNLEYLPRPEIPPRFLPQTHVSPNSIPAQYYKPPQQYQTGYLHQKPVLHPNMHRTPQLYRPVRFESPSGCWPVRNGYLQHSQITRQLQSLETFGVQHQNGSAELSKTNTRTPSPKISKQVSLGNLDFAAAEECDGFLVVPLRNSSPANVVGTSRRYLHAACMVGPNRDRLNTNPTLTKSAENLASDFPKNNLAASLTKTSLSSNVLSPSIERSLSHSHMAKPGATTANYENTKDNANSSKQNAQNNNYTGVDLQSSSHCPTFNHCKRCNRPHTMYHGIVQCHSDVEDFRQELQYLDIAGLESRNHGQDSLLLRDFGHRRSAFTKYMPAERLSFKAIELETDTMSSSASKQTLDSKRRQSFSAESDYFSSNYTTSHSDTQSRGSRVHYTAGSDRSNDTFSEYDMHSESKPTADNQEDYTYILAKVRHNLTLKEDVKRIIRDSESETGTQSDNLGQDSQEFVDEDTISLTSVSSLSEFPAVPSEEQFSRDTRVRRNCLKKSGVDRKKILNAQESTGNQTSDSANSFTRLRKPIRKKKKHATDAKPVYYKLPTFPTVLAPASSTGEIGLDANVIPKCQTAEVAGVESGTVAELVTHKSISTPSPDPDTMDITTDESHAVNAHTKLAVSSHSQKTRQSVHDKLSCRVSNLSPSDISTLRKQVPLKQSRSAALCGEDNETPRMAMAPPPPTNSQSINNSLLSDLLRRNHDRQHFM